MKLALIYTSMSCIALALPFGNACAQTGHGGHHNSGHAKSSKPGPKHSTSRTQAGSMKSNHSNKANAGKVADPSGSGQKHAGDHIAPSTNQQSKSSSQSTKPSFGFWDGGSGISKAVGAGDGGSIPNPPVPNPRKVISNAQQAGQNILKQSQDVVSNSGNSISAGLKFTKQGLSGTGLPSLSSQEGFSGGSMKTGLNNAKQTVSDGYQDGQKLGTTAAGQITSAASNSSVNVPRPNFSVPNVNTSSVTAGRPSTLNINTKTPRVGKLKPGPAIHKTETVLGAIGEALAVFFGHSSGGAQDGGGQSNSGQGSPSADAGSSNGDGSDSGDGSSGGTGNGDGVDKPQQVSGAFLRSPTKAEKKVDKRPR